MLGNVAPTLPIEGVTGVLHVLVLDTEATLTHVAAFNNLHFCQIIIGVYVSVCVSCS